MMDITKKTVYKYEGGGGKWIFLVDKELHSMLLADLNENPCVELRDAGKTNLKIPKGGNFLKKVICMVLFNDVFQRITFPLYLCFKVLMLFGLKNILGFCFRKDVVFRIVMHSSFLQKIQIESLCKVKKNKNIRLYILLLDSWDASSPALELSKEYIGLSVWDGIFTFDEYDAKRFGWKYIGQSYWSKPEVKLNFFPSNDLYFVGGLKGGREKLIFDVLKKIEDSGLKSEFDLSAIYHDGDLEKFRLLNTSANIYREWIPYKESLEKMMNSNCILEILQNGQTQQSLRYFEAVAFNKKLLTNNANISNLTFYDERYMKCFEKVEDIDCEWVKKRERIDYGYNGEFSPVHLLEIMEQAKKC